MRLAQLHPGEHDPRSACMCPASNSSRIVSHFTPHSLPWSVVSNPRPDSFPAAIFAQSFLPYRVLAADSFCFGSSIPPSAGLDFRIDRVSSLRADSAYTIPWLRAVFTKARHRTDHLDSDCVGCGTYNTEDLYIHRTLPAGSAWICAGSQEQWFAQP